jgi:hypothetical protein
VAFRALSPEAIRKQAEKSLRKNLKSEGNTLSFAALSSVGWMPCLGCLALLIPGVGIFVCVALWVLSGLLWLLSGGAFIYGWVRPVDEHQLAGLCYKWRNMCEGNCPICKAHIYIMPDTDPQNATCPMCSGPLLYSQGHIAPR